MNSRPSVSNVLCRVNLKCGLLDVRHEIYSFSLSLSLSLCEHIVLVGRFPFDVTVCACLVLSVQPIEYVDTHTHTHVITQLNSPPYPKPSHMCHGVFTSKVC